MCCLRRRTCLGRFERRTTVRATSCITLRGAHSRSISTHQRHRRSTSGRPSPRASTSSGACATSTSSVLISASPNCFRRRRSCHVRPTAGIPFHRADAPIFHTDSHLLEPHLPQPVTDGRPTRANQLQRVAHGDAARQSAIERMAAETAPFLHARAMRLAEVPQCALVSPACITIPTASQVVALRAYMLLLLSLNILLPTPERLHSVA